MFTSAVFASDVCECMIPRQLPGIATFRERYPARWAGADAGSRRRHAIVRATYVAGDVQTRYRVDRWPATVCRSRVDGDRNDHIDFGDLI